MIKMKDLNSGFMYRSSWTGYVKGRGLDLSDVPVLHSARIDANQVYRDPFKGPRHSFLEKNTTQFKKLLKTREHAYCDTAGKTKPTGIFGSAN